MGGEFVVGIVILRLFECFKFLNFTNFVKCLKNWVPSFQANPCLSTIHSLYSLGIATQSSVIMLITLKHKVRLLRMIRLS